MRELLLNPQNNLKTFLDGVQVPLEELLRDLPAILHLPDPVDVSEITSEIAAKVLQESGATSTKIPAVSVFCLLFSSHLRQCYRHSNLMQVCTMSLADGCLSS